MFPNTIIGLGKRTLLGLGLMLGSAGVLAQSASCDYVITNDWNSGATVSVDVTNTGNSTIDGWELSWEYDANRITSSWNVQLSGSNPYTASDMGWNASIEPDQTVSFGFQVDKNGGEAEQPEITGDICSEGGSASSPPASSSSSSAAQSSVAQSSAPPATGGSQCNWYGTPTPLCENTNSGWGWENNESCVSPSTCESQPEPYGIIEDEGDSSVSSSVASSAPSSSSASSAASSAPPDDNGLTFTSLANQADFPIGVALPAGNEGNSVFNDNAIGQGQRDVTIQHFSEITAENIMKMSYLHDQLGNFTFGDADELVDWAISNNIGVHGHALVWHPEYQVPSWAQNFQGSEEDWVEALREHVTGVASHFSGRVDSWDVVNEAFLDSGYREESVFYQAMGPRYIEEAFIAAREAAPDADLYYNDYSMEDGQPKFGHAMDMVDDFLERGIPIDGVGFQFHVLIDWPSTNSMRQVFSEVVDRGLMVKITELDIPINNPYDGQYSYPDNYIAEFTPEVAEQQKVRYCQVVEAYLDEVPPAQRGGISVWGVFDSHSWLIEQTFENNHDEWPLLFNDNFEPKPAAQGVGDALAGLPCQ